MQQQENRLRLHVLVIGWLVIVALAAVSFALGYRFGRRGYADKTPTRVQNPHVTWSGRAARRSGL